MPVKSKMGISLLYEIKKLATARRQDLGIQEQKDPHRSSITFHVATKHSAATTARHLKGPSHPSSARQPHALPLSAASVLRVGRTLDLAKPLSS